MKGQVYIVRTDQSTKPQTVRCLCITEMSFFELVIYLINSINGMILQKYK